jgi:hypothetical protein
MDKSLEKTLSMLSDWLKNEIFVSTSFAFSVCLVSSFRFNGDRSSFARSRLLCFFVHLVNVIANVFVKEKVSFDGVTVKLD